MTLRRTGLLVASLALLAACNNDLDDQPGALIVFETAAAYPLGGDNNLQAYWVAALHPETHEVLDAQPIIPGETTTLIKPFLFTQSTYDLALIRGFGSDDFTGGFTRVQVTMYEDFIPTVITLSGGGGAGGDPTVGIFPRMESTLNGVTDAEFGTYNYRLLSDVNTAIGEHDGAAVTFSSDEFGSRSGRYLLLREYRDQTPGWWYQQRLNQDGSQPMVFENQDWIDTEVSSYSFNSTASSVSTSVSGATPGGSSIQLSSSLSDVGGGEFFYPIISDVFPLQRVSLNATWDNDNSNQQYSYFNEGNVPAEIPTYDAELAVASSNLPDFSAELVAGEADYIRGYFSVANNDFSNGYIDYNVIYNPEGEVWSPLLIEWSGEMRNNFPFLELVQGWQQQYTSVAAFDFSYYDSFNAVIDQLANQRQASDDDGYTSMSMSYNYFFP